MIPDQPVSYIDAILFHASKAPNDPAIGLESGVITYGQLADAMYGATAACERAGLRPGALAAIMVTDPVWHVCLVGALHRLGVVSVSLLKDQEGVFAPGVLTTILHDGSYSGTVGGPSAIQVTPDWFSQRGTPRMPPMFGAHDLCRISLSSGTTGTAKPIAFSEHILWHRLYTYSFRGRFAASERIFCGPLLPSQFGFAITFSALAYGKMVCFSNNAGTAMPVMSYYKTDLAIVSVYQLNEMIDVMSKTRGGLSGVRELQAGGALISDVMLQRARSAMSCEIVSTYASTEGGTVAFAPVEQLGSARSEGAVGFVVPWAKVEVFDDEKRPVPPGRDGNIRISTLGNAPYFTPGMTTVENPGPFFPGDHGRLTNDGLLVVAGRSTEVINIGGNKVSPDRFESILMQVEGVRDAAVFTVDINSALPQVWAAIVADPGLSVAEVMKQCFAQPMIGAPQVIRLVPEIPRNMAGKILRDQLRAGLTKTTG
jgi:acyl-coenzyme A synthetase/AMP-(fatty) acid ligase